MEYLDHIHNSLKDNNEIVIIERYASKAKRYTIILIRFFHISIQIWSNFYNAVSVNGSHRHHLQILTEYFIDQQRYFYLLLLHINSAFYIGIFALVATGTMLISYLQYACGMFRIASYRIENAMKIQISQNIILQNISLPHKRIICAVDIQRKAMMFSEYLISQFEISFMLLIVVGVLTLSLNIFRVFQIITSKFVNFEELSIPFVSSISCLVYMFLSNYVGQEITDHHNHVFNTTYKIQWYLAPLQIQKLILFLMQRSNKSFGLNVGGLFVASLECFATLANTSISYFVVIYSTR
ncbi:uncharacterized protein LOC105425377 [Pogonomyrmex barbatus]|uniref:Uncharacterized protein LOC105425377 n=1 Tax=Pogonomyrmex barbatus TaxID=144034 RepID=A0A6I9VYT4_9HYME|nr:uncharacterized protein LOC105425377 [Pogonomyrmex barbatus]